MSCGHRYTTPTGPAQDDELAAAAPKRSWQRLSARQQGRSALRLAAARSGCRPPPAAGAPLDLQTNRAGLLHLPQQPPGASGRTGPRRRKPPEHRGNPQFAKNEIELDHDQVRRYNAWHRHITLSMLAAAFYAVTAHHERQLDVKGGATPNDEHLIQLSCDEIRRLWAIRTLPTHPDAPTDPLATLATPAPNPRSPKPLPATTFQTSRGAAAVIGR